MQRLFNRIHDGLNTRPLLAAVAANSHLWDQITARQDHPASSHRATKTIFLRWSKEFSVQTVFTDLEAVDCPALDVLPQARDLITEVCRLVGSIKLARVIITKLPPGGEISEHADEGPYADAFERFHVPLQADRSLFVNVYSDDHKELCQMKTGELWTFHHKKKHQVLNDGEQDRIHLIIDAIAPSYRRERDEH